jgi:hypothetical protein
MHQQSVAHTYDNMLVNAFLYASAIREPLVGKYIKESIVFFDRNNLPVDASHKKERKRISAEKYNVRMIPKNDDQICPFVVAGMRRLAYDLTINEHIDLRESISQFFVVLAEKAKADKQK